MPISRVTCLLLLSLIFLALNPSCSLAQIYKYTDQSGKTHYVDSLKKVPEQYKDQTRESHKLPSITKIPAAKWDRAYLKRSTSTQKVEVFVTSWCPHCKTLEDALKANKVKYTRYDIEKNAKGKKLYDAIGHKGVPLTRIGSKIITGANTAAILSHLK